MGNSVEKVFNKKGRGMFPRGKICQWVNSVSYQNNKHSNILIAIGTLHTLKLIKTVK